MPTIPKYLQRSFEGLTSRLLFALTLVSLMFGYRSLYTTPIADSVRWGGDETWLMREFGTQAKTGVMQYPENYEPTPRTDGLLAGSMWFNALVYGVAGNALASRFNLVSIGRTVSALAGLALFAIVVIAVKRFGGSVTFAGIAALLLAASRGFFWASHSARYDMITGLVLLCWILVCGRLFSDCLHGISITGKRAFFFGVGSVMPIVFSRHLLTLTPAITITTLVAVRIWENRRNLIMYFAGGVASFTLLSIAYLAGTGEFSLFGAGGSFGSYRFVLGQLPILRPFSRSVQVSNLLERFHLIGVDAPAVLFLLLAAGAISTWAFFKRKSQLFSLGNKFLFSCTAGSMLSWLLLQGSRPYYLMHILPLVVVTSTVILSRLVPENGYVRGTLLACGVILAMVFTRDVMRAEIVGSAITNDQSAAIHAFLDRIHGESPIRRPLVIADVAGLSWVLADTLVKTITLDVLQVPANREEAILKLRGSSANYAIIRSSPLSSPFEPGRAALPRVLDSVAILEAVRIGNFYDDGRSYAAPNLGAKDTLKLYGIQRRQSWRIRG